MVSGNLKTAKYYFIEAKTYELIPHQSLFQHELGYMWPTI